MKKTIKNLAGVLVIALIALSVTTVNAQNKAVKVDKSTVVWKGYKVTGSHDGTIKLKSGSLNFNNGKLTGGEFVMDMTSIIVTDLEGNYKTKLENHLKNDDFFGVEENPTAKLVFKSVKSAGDNVYKVTGDLTIKGITNAISFDFSVNGNKGKAALKIDRAKFNVKYGSSSFFDNLQDKAIYDEFDLTAELEF